MNGETRTAKTTGDGPIDATFNAIKAIYPHDWKLKLYQVHAVTEGTDAQGTVTVKLDGEDRTVVGNASDTDTVVASCMAYVTAVNKLIEKSQKTAPEAMAS